MQFFSSYPKNDNNASAYECVWRLHAEFRRSLDKVVKDAGKRLIQCLSIVLPQRYTLQQVIKKR